MITYDAWLRWRACGRKRQLARLDANRLTLEAWKSGDGAMQPYRCEYCQSWHIGHDGQRRAA
jgi:hypothetical protein